MQVATQVKAPQTKPGALYEAIKELDSVSNRLNSLRDRICGKDQPENIEKGREGSVPLLSLLDDGPTMITSKIQEFYERINEIEDLLFHN